MNHSHTMQIGGETVPVTPLVQPTNLKSDQRAFLLDLKIRRDPWLRLYAFRAALLAHAGRNPSP